MSDPNESPSTVDNGARLGVAFSFYTGVAGVSRPGAGALATVAYRSPDLPRRWEKSGTVDGAPVEVLSVDRSTVPGFIRVAVRFPPPPPAQAE